MIHYSYIIHILYTKVILNHFLFCLVLNSQSFGHLYTLTLGPSMLVSKMSYNRHLYYGNSIYRSKISVAKSSSCLLKNQIDVSAIVRLYWTEVSASNSSHVAYVWLRNMAGNLKELPHHRVNARKSKCMRQRLWNTWELAVMFM